MTISEESHNRAHKVTSVWSQCLVNPVSAKHIDMLNDLIAIALDAQTLRLENRFKKDEKIAKKLSKKLKQKARLAEVWVNFINWADDADCIDEVQERLEEWLDELHGEDAFGTEGQSDPRGDGRELRCRI